jgi:LysM repeat protein
MKKVIFILLALPLFVKAQEGSLTAEGTAGNLYLNHTAVAKENFYSIGRLYNISPKEIAPFNNLAMDKGFSIGQNLKIPLKAENFIQSNSVAVGEAAVPVYHKVEAKETLYQLSTRFNKVPVASLKAWNNLQDDVVSPGQGLIIGYLKVKKDLSSLSQNSVTMPTVKSEAAAVVVKEKEPAKKEIAPKPAEVKETVKAPVKVVEKKVEPMVKKDPIVTRVEEVAVSDEAEARDFKGGIFKSLYSNGGNEASGTAGVFKSTSGWEDGKYYCLHNAASQGTIIKITNKANGKFVYAKVLDVMPDLKQNNNLQIRISNAAADILGAGLSNFECSISY